MGGVPDANGPEDVSTDRDVTPPWESDQRDVLRATFDQGAEAYDRSRPVAPDDVFDEVMQRASLSAGSTVVEIGPGTGQATRHLAARGLDVVAVELGPHLAERARANLAAFPQVSVVTASFESWDPGAARFDGVFACNSFTGSIRTSVSPRRLPCCAGADISWSSRLHGWFPRRPTGFGGTCRTTGQPLARASTRRRCIRTSSGMIFHSRYGHPACSRSRRSRADCLRSPS